MYQDVIARETARAHWQPAQDEMIRLAIELGIPARNLARQLRRTPEAVARRMQDLAPTIVLTEPEPGEAALP